MRFGFKMQFIQFRSRIAAFPISRSRLPNDRLTLPAERFKLYFALHYGKSILNIHHSTFALPVYSPAGIRCNRLLTRFEEICILKEFFFMWTRWEKRVVRFSWTTWVKIAFYAITLCTAILHTSTEGWSRNVNFSACSEISSRPEAASSTKLHWSACSPHQSACKCTL